MLRLFHIFCMITTAFTTATDYISVFWLLFNAVSHCPCSEFLSYERDPVRSCRRHASVASNGMHSPIRFALISDGRGTGCQAEKSKRSVLASPPPAAAEPTYHHRISRLNKIKHIHRSHIITLVVLCLETTKKMVHLGGYWKFSNESKMDHFGWRGCRFHVERLWCTLHHAYVCCGEV